MGCPASERSRMKEPIPPSRRVLEAYEPLLHAGHLEAKMLREHPDWVQTHPWRFLVARCVDSHQTGKG